jgi:hypothetical protein
MINHPIAFPIWFWDTTTHRPEGVCETEAELAGSVEWTDSESLSYILIDVLGRRCIVETNDHLEIIRFEIIDEEPINTSLELLALMQEMYPKDPR